MLIGYKRGQGSIVLRVKILNSTTSTGAGKTGLSSASSGLIISTIADNEASATAYTVAGSLVETISTLGTYAAPTATKCRFKEVDATNHPGVYEIQIADARFAVSSAKSLLVSVLGATGGADCDVVIPLRDLDPYDSVRAGLTSLPNAAAEASGGLPTLSAAQASNGTIQSNVHRWLTGTPNALQSGRVDSYLGAVASGVIAAASFAANALDAVWSTAARLLTAGTNIVLAKGVGVTGFNDLDAAGVRGAVGLATANLDTQIGTLATSANLATVASYLDTEIADILADTNELQTDWVNGGRLDLILDARASQTSVDDLPTNAELSTALGSLPTAAENADAVWEEAIADHSGTAGSTAEALAAAGSAGDPWATALPGAYSAGQAGKIVGDNLNATVSSRATQTSVDDVPTNAELATALGTADDATLAAIAGLTIPTANQNADALLDRSNAIETGLTVRGSFRLALAALAGKLSGADTSTTTIRNAVADSKDRIVATTAASGRTSVTTDVS